MSMIKKIAVCFACTLLAILLAAIYGVIHNQITYSIAPEYFTIFKFDQFGFSDWGMQSPRLTTALIGILATWWMGLFLGAFLSILGLIHSDYKTMFRFVMRSIYITFLVTILSGVLGYVVGWFDTETYKSCCFPYNIQDPINFTLVGSIHSYGYAGAPIGAVLGILYQIIMKKKNV
jgi:hypothetical protein